jgi:DNA polymerase-3 subunit alpha
MIGHFHTHSHYSILDGAMTIDQLVSRAKERKIDAIAITEHGNIFSAVEFFYKAKEHGIKPIIGCEIYIAPSSLSEKTQEEKNYHATLIVKDEIGYKNLCLLLKIANVEGFYRKPRIDFKTLYEYKEGLIVLSGCLNGIIPRLIAEGKIDKAKEKVLELKSIFKDDFYLEIMRAEPANPKREEDIATVAIQKKINQYLLEFSEDFQIKAVATGDCHYADPEGYEIQDILVCIAYGEKLKNENRFRYKVKGLYVKSKDEMMEIFKDIPDSLNSHEEIIRKCTFEFKKPKELKIPKPKEFGNPDETLRKKAYEGIKKLLQEKKERGEKFDEKIYYEQMEKELDVISKKNFSSYFLIVEDFINYARQNGIMVGPGRGSAAGSIVAWALGITKIDPIKYGLIFERFLNPEREKPPDIDVDFCKERRDEVIEYVKRKYGEENVSHIITFGTFGARAAIRDVGRIFDEPLEDVSYLAELIPQEPSRKWTIEDAYNEIQEFRTKVEENPRFKRIFENAKKIEGLIRHVGSHASGFIISDKPITDYTSIHRSKDGFTTQFDMENLEKIGLVKFDFLGLETLTVINKTFELIKQRYKKEINFHNIPLDDKKTYDMLKRGDVFGVFQFESAGMKELLQKLEPSIFEDLIAAVALYRPGPIQSGMVNDFIERKKGLKPVEYPHPLLEPILKETYGNFLYQEQIMFAANILANFTMGEADILREAMGKKKADLMAQMRERFISGCIENGIEESKAIEIFDIMEKFAGYAFNKSHSAAYAFLSYVTAYLKANYPLEYMAALLSSEMNNFEKLTSYIEELLKLGFKILPPSITKSNYEFSVEGDAIRFGLGGIKGLGEAAAKAIIQMREKIKINSFESFLRNCQRFKINKKIVEILIKANAFYEFIDRKKALTMFEAFLSGKVNLFDKINGKEITQEELDRMEIEVIGIPLSRIIIEDEINSITQGIFPIEIKDFVQIAGIVEWITPSKYGFILNVRANGKASKYEVLLINKEGEKIKKDELYVFLGKRSGKNLIVSKKFFKIENLAILINVPGYNMVDEKLKKLKEILSAQKDGNLKVIVEYKSSLFEYKRKISFSTKFKEELWENGFYFLAIPQNYFTPQQQNNLTLTQT